MFSCIKENPGPLVAVTTFCPPQLAPIMAPTAEISSSICMNLPPTVGSFLLIISAISVDGVIG